MCRELVAKVLNMFKNFMRIFFAKIFRKTVARLSCDVRVSVANLSPRNFGEFKMRNFRDTRTNVVRPSRDSLEKTCEHLATIWLESKTKRMSRDCRTNENEDKLHSRESRETLSRMFHGCRATVAQLSRDSREVYFQN